VRKREDVMKVLRTAIVGAWISLALLCTSASAQGIATFIAARQM